MPEETYTAWGPIVASYLPDDPLDFGDFCRVEKVSPERAEQLSRSRPRLKHPQFGAGRPATYSVEPGERLVQSRHVAWFRVWAHSIDEAEFAVQTRLAPPLLAALSAVGDQPARFELLRIGETEPDGYIPSPASPFTDWAKFSIYEPKSLIGRRRRERLALTETIGTDDKARDLALRYVEALYQHDMTSSDRPLRQAGVTVAFFLIVEHIADSVGRADETIDIAAQQRIIDDLVPQLDRDGGAALGIQVRAIRRAAAELGRLDRVHLADRIDAAARWLRIDDEARESAHEVRRARNKLSHPGALPGDELNRLVVTAESSARSFLGAYARESMRGLDV